MELATAWRIKQQEESLQKEYQHNQSKVQEKLEQLNKELHIRNRRESQVQTESKPPKSTFSIAAQTSPLTLNELEAPQKQRNSVPNAETDADAPRTRDLSRHPYLRLSSMWRNFSPIAKSRIGRMTYLAL